MTTFLNILGFREKMSARFIKNMSHETLANYFRIFTLTKSRLDLNIPDTPAYLRHCRKETNKQKNELFDQTLNLKLLSNVY